MEGVIAIDAHYARIADSRHLGATIAHELAHYLDFAGDNDSDLIEARARQIAEGTWGFPQGEVIYKCEQCRRIDTILKKRGITGGVFWEAEMDSFVYLRDKRRIRLLASYHLLKEDVENSLADILDSDIILSFRSKEDKIRHRQFREKARLSYHDR